MHAKYERKTKRARKGSLLPSGSGLPIPSDYGSMALTGGISPLLLYNLAEILASDLKSEPEPEAYMGYALYDADSNLYEKGKILLSKRSENKHEELREKLYIQKSGHAETFLVNETNEDVWFDNFRIESTPPLIVQETHYDPWGLELMGLGYQYGGIKVNKYLNQGKEWLDDHGLNIFDFHARGYDPAIARTLQMDPHAENYFSLSPFNWLANNPILFTDPDGKDITFYIGKDKVKFGDLNQDYQKALEAFAKTDVGKQFLAQFANKGDKIGSVEFKEAGKNSKHEMQFGQKTDKSDGRPGTNGTEISREKLTFYTIVNTSAQDSPESYALTLGHESFIHQEQFQDRMIAAHDNSDWRTLNDIRHDRGQISRDGYGRTEHNGYLKREPSFKKMYQFIDQIRRILNPTEFNSNLLKHDKLLKSLENNY